MNLTKEFIKKTLPTATIINEHLISRGGTKCSVSIDTRSLEPGQLFFALKGGSVDGHDFISQAIERGACGLVVSEEVIVPTNMFCITVSDSTTALVAMARAWRRRFSCPIVGITGSIGKTTTKEMVRDILQYAGIPHCASHKNQNTLIGLALNILKMNEGCRAGVFEVGISECGEMAPNADLLRPTIGVITRISHSHIEGVGSIENIVREKKDIFKFFTDDDVAVVYGAQEELACSKGRCITFGMDELQVDLIHEDFVRASEVATVSSDDGRLCTKFLLSIGDKSATTTLHDMHEGHVFNVLAASAVANLLGVSLKIIGVAIDSFRPRDGRFERRRLKGGRGWLIDDRYNANPESMEAALRAFNAMCNVTTLAGVKKIAVLGDMLELGPTELELHEQIGRVLCDTTSVMQVVLVGERARWIARTMPSTVEPIFASDWQEAASFLEKNVTRCFSLVLVKGSLGMNLSNLVVHMCE